MNSIDAVDLEKKKVFVRIDLDCGNINNKELLDIKIANCLPTIRYLLEKEAKIVIGTHLGSESDIKRNRNKYSLEPIGVVLSDILKKDVFFVDSILNDSFKKLLIDLPYGSLILLDNLAFIENETGDNQEFAQFLAGKIDFYLNDAFSLCDLTYATLHSVLDYKEKEKIAIGFNFKNEYDQLIKIKNGIERPSVLFLNGKNADLKLEFAGKFIDHFDLIVLMGEIANTHSKVMSSSFSGEYEQEHYYSVKNFISSARARNIKILKMNLDSDGKRFDMPSNDVEYLADTITEANSVIWYGKVEGMEDLQNSFEASEGFKSTLGIDAELSLKDKAYVKSFDFISGSNQAAIDYLLGKPLSVLEKLISI